ncbi:putative siderophore iron transporter [Rhexocercosporidium sp. MPI-PUGE-AT-0058]|nr:putative siderophore iron transporter [Rhexocercosporidium sp. MPI-PUGE-AT-0058]
MMSSNVAPAEKAPNSGAEIVQTSIRDKNSVDEKQIENVNTEFSNMEYNNDDEEPEFHARTWLALAAMFLLNLVQVVALQGPPAMLAYIGEDLHNKAAEPWVPNSLSLVQAVISPLIASASDAFQARKLFLVGPCLLSFIGSAIAPGSTSIYRLIVAQILIGFGFATVPLAYVVPSEILPRKWRPMAQGAMNVAASIGSCSGPLIIGALTKRNAHTGWRNFYWIQMALWGSCTLGLFFGYKPPKRHSRLDHLSFGQKLARLDLPGCGLLTTGLTLLLVGMNLGSSLYEWTDAPVLATIIIGCITLLCFGIYEWKFMKTGILHHDLFRGGKSQGRAFAIFLGLIFIEGITLFCYIIFYPALTSALFETDPFLQVARAQPGWICGMLSTAIYGFVSTKMRSIRVPLAVGFVLVTGGIIGLATIEPSDSTSAIIFSGLWGLGFGAPLCLIIAGVQLSTPQSLIATATALTSSTRAIAGTMFTSIYVATVNGRMDKFIPKYVGKAAIVAGLPASSVPAFVGALASQNMTALPTIPGVTPVIIGAGVAGIKQAAADGIRAVFMIAAPFGALGAICCFFLGSLKDQMNYRVDAPVEELHAKHQHGEQQA